MPDLSPANKMQTPLQTSGHKKIPSVVMIDVPGGSIVLGDLKLRVDSFMISKYETTQAEYFAVMNSNPSKLPSRNDPSTFNNYPVNQVNWFDAIEYCNRRSIKENLTPCYRFSVYGDNPDNWPTNWNKKEKNRSMIECIWEANGYRLPTETEWMFAAAGGTKTNNYIYSGGDDVSSVSNCNTTASHPVGSKYPNELGIHDMSGNVSEWCWDIYGGYPRPILENYRGKYVGTKCTRRGGSFGNSALSSQVLTRSYANVAEKNSSMGFRTCRSSK